MTDDEAKELQVTTTGCDPAPLTGAVHTKFDVPDDDTTGQLVPPTVTVQDAARFAPTKTSLLLPVMSRPIFGVMVAMLG